MVADTPPRVGYGRDLIDRVHVLIAAEMKKQGIKDAPAIERLAARVGVTSGELQAMMRQPHNCSVEEFADVFLGLFKAEMGIVALPVENQPSLTKPVVSWARRKTKPAASRQRPAARSAFPHTPSALREPSRVRSPKPTIIRSSKGLHLPSSEWASLRIGAWPSRGSARAEVEVDIGKVLTRSTTCLPHIPHGDSPAGPTAWCTIH